LVYVMLETEGSLYVYDDPSVIRQHRADATSPMKYENTVWNSILENYKNTV
jgi:hypothetical protein